MNGSLPEQDLYEPARLSKGLGCGIILLIIFLSLWVAGFCGVNLIMRWSIEQAMFESDMGITDLRWSTQLIFSVLLLLPLIPTYFIAKAPRIKLMSRLWIIGVGFALLSIPAKFLYLTSQVQSFILLSAAALLMALILFLFKKPAGGSMNAREKSGLMGATALVGLAISIPWLLWGSLGSPLDTIVVLILGFSVGLMVVNSIFPFYLEKTQTVDREVKSGEFLFDGFVIAIFLLIVVTGISQNGSETMLVLCLPPAGWLITAFTAAAKDQKDHGKLAAGIIVGLLTSLPLLFFDIDELSQIFSGSTGEMMQWASQAAIYDLIFLIISILAVVFLFKHLNKLQLPGKVNYLVAGISVIVFAVIYVTLGTPGFFGDQLFVVFSDQVDTAEFTGIEPLAQRKEALYQAMTAQAEKSQSILREKLQRLGIEYTPYYLVNGMEVNGGFFLQLWLQKQPGVDRVLNSPHFRPLPEPLAVSTGDVTTPPDGTLWNLEMINVPQVHDELGITGQGIVIGQTDSGVDGSHPELKGSYRGADGSNDFNWLDTWNGTKQPMDIGGHGTSTLGIEVGATRGIAPDAQWIGCVNLARNLGNTALYLDCMQFMFAPYPQLGDAFLDGEPSLGAMIINNSWGCPRVEGCDATIFEPAVKVLKAAGIFMSAAAGNAGYYGCSTITDPPAIYADVFTAGSVDKLGYISAFSSLGPVTVDGSNRSKPDLLAPGEQILLAAPNGTYMFASGTSFAAPHVSGVVALMWSANPDLIGDIDATTCILLETAKPYTRNEPDCGSASYASGAGILDAYAAVNAALAVK